jgi:hypothetical protein
MFVCRVTARPRHTPAFFSRYTQCLIIRFGAFVRVSLFCSKRRFGDSSPSSVAGIHGVLDSSRSCPIARDHGLSPVLCVWVVKMLLIPCRAGPF